MLAVYTDGACTTNYRRDSPSIGGWAWWVNPDLLAYDNASPTTNNRMELTAVIEAMKSLAPMAYDEGGIVIYTDSLYIVDCFAEGWYVKWRRDNWMRYEPRLGGGIGKEVANRDLWEQLIALYEEYLRDGTPVSFRHVRGHGKNPHESPVHVHGNDRADYYAIKAKMALIKRQNASMS